MITYGYAKKHAARAASIFHRCADLKTMAIKNFGEESYHGQKAIKLASAAYDCMIAMEDMMEHIRQSNPRARQAKKYYKQSGLPDEIPS